MTRRQMLQVAAFLVGLFVLDRALGLGLRAALAHARGGDLTGRINTVLELARRAEVLTFGSSRAAFHVDPRVIEAELGVPALNLGSKGRGILYARMLQTLLLQRGGRPRLVLLQAEPNDLYTLKAERANLFAPYYDENPVVRAELDGADRSARLRLFSYAYRFNDLIPSLAVNAVRPSRFPFETRGFVPGAGSLAGELPPRPEEIDVGEGNGVERPLPRALALYRDFARDALAHGADVLMFSGPRFRSGPPAPLEQRGMDAFAALASELGVPYRPMTEQSYPEFTDGSLYFDPSHLNESGARRLTERLVEEIRALGFPDGAR